MMGLEAQRIARLPKTKEADKRGKLYSPQSMKPGTFYKDRSGRWMHTDGKKVMRIKDEATVRQLDIQHKKQGER